MSGCETIVRMLIPEDRSSLELLLQGYVEDEPASKHLQLTELDKQAFVEIYSQFAIDGKTSFGCFEKKTGEMCAFGITILSQYGDDLDSSLDNYEQSGNASPQFKILRRFDKFMECDIADYLGNSNYLIAELMYVLPQFRMKNIGKQIRQKAYDITSKFDCIALVTVAFSDYIARSLAKEGFVPVKVVDYKSYRDEITGEVVFLGLESVDKCCSLLVKMLKNNKSKL